LVGTDPDRIVAEVWRLLDDPAARKAMSAAPGLYGDGKAAPRILAGLRQFLDSQS
jgi:UDP-N-acetylglucosamine 2-epimerase (non-hydrolysing)